MATYSVSKSFSLDTAVSDKAAAVMRMFGLTLERLSEQGVSHNCTLQINPGDIVYITGPSGAGKTVLLREIENAVPNSQKLNLNQIELPDDKMVIDCMDGDFMTGLKLLSAAGLNDAFCVLNRPRRLSEGQQYRFRLAMALSAGSKFVFADEFCTNLDRLTAAVISYNIRKHAKKTQTTFVLASSHDDLLLDLSPDVLVAKELSGHAEVIYKRAGVKS